MKYAKRILSLMLMVSVLAGILIFPRLVQTVNVSRRRRARDLLRG